MALKVKRSIKKYIPKIIFGIIGVIFLGLVTYLAIWEKNYYAEKEGSERMAPGVVGDIVVEEEEVSNEPIPEKTVKEYRVAADKPRYITIEKLGINNARIIEIGVKKNGQMATPNNIYDAGWYNKSAKPGTGKTAILDGHNGGPGVNGIFKNLKNLQAGDIIIIEMGDGRILNYRVYDNVSVKLEDANKKMAEIQNSPVEGVESISIISCVGEWSQKQRTYLSRQFLRATLM
jgi:LPXTG-site transpeptidase (sortase) family protein